MKVKQLQSNLFDNVNMPESFTPLLFYDNLRIKYGEYVMISNNLDELLYDIQAFFSINYYKYNKLAETTKLTYNPIENYNMRENVTNENIGVTSSDSTNSEYTIDTDTLKESMQNVTTNNSNINGITETERSGNIGVTTTQQMIESERKISDFNLYDIMCMDFVNTFCFLLHESEEI